MAQPQNSSVPAASVAPRRTRARRRAGSIVAALAATMVLAACSSSSGTPQSSAPVSSSEVAKALEEPTTITFWSWVPNIEDEVALFEKAHPAIDVKVVNAGQGLPQYTKLRTAFKAGKGAPDVAQVEYQYIPSFTLGNDLLDLAPYGAGDLEKQYPAWVWKQVAKGDAVYAVPQDIGPMGLLYREDILQQAGIAPPTTWEEFAAAATALHAANPEQYLTNLPGNDAGQVIGLMWQNGASPFGFDGDKTVKIDLDTPEVTKVVDYWQGLVQQGVVSTDPDFTDQWYQALSNGTYASWVTAAWGPVFLQGTAESTSGLWRASRLPQWDVGATASGNWGGSTSAVMASSEHKIVAAELAKFLNTDPTSTKQLTSQQFLFPASTTVLEDPSFTSQTPEFYGGQQVNQVFADASGNVNTDFGWLPFTDYAYNSFNDTLGKTIAEKGDMRAGLEAWQQDLVRYATAQGFTVG